MPRKSKVRADTMPKNPKNELDDGLSIIGEQSSTGLTSLNQQENSKSSPTPREQSYLANKPQNVSFFYTFRISSTICLMLFAFRKAVSN